MLNLVQDQFDSVFGKLTPPPVEHDRESMQLKTITDSLQAMRPHMNRIGDALQVTQAAGMQQMLEDAKAKRLLRLDELVGMAKFIEKADLAECKHIVNELIDRVSELTGSATELEDAASALTAAMECEPCEPRCKCDACMAARSDEEHDRRRDGLMMRGA